MEYGTVLRIQEEKAKQQRYRKKETTIGNASIKNQHLFLASSGKQNSHKLFLINQTKLLHKSKSLAKHKQINFKYISNRNKC